MLNYEQFSASLIEAVAGKAPKKGAVVAGGTYIGNSKGYQVIVAPKEGGQHFGDWKACKSWCESLTLNDFSDWSMPTKEELALMEPLASQLELHNTYFWSSSERSNTLAWGRGFYPTEVSASSEYYKPFTSYARAVRRVKI